MELGAKSHAGDTPAWLAAMNGHAAALRLLQEAWKYPVQRKTVQAFSHADELRGARSPLTRVEKTEIAGISSQLCHWSQRSEGPKNIRASCYNYN